MEASRCLLRHEGRSYGTQQVRKLSNSLTAERGSLSDYALHSLLLCLKSKANKWWVRRVAAAAVIPAPQVVTAIIGSKASVAGSTSSWLNPAVDCWLAENTVRLGIGKGERYSTCRG